MTFDEYAQQQGWIQVINDDGNPEWRRPDGNGGYQRVSGSNLDGMQEQYQASQPQPVAVGQQVDYGNGQLGYWYPSGQGWENNPGIPAGSIVQNITQNGQPGFIVQKAAMDAAHPGDNELADFAKTAGLAFGGAALATGGLGGLSDLLSSSGAAGGADAAANATYSGGLMGGAEGGFDVGMGGGTLDALGLGSGTAAAGAAANGLTDVQQWASQYGPNALNADGTLNWDAITQGMASQQGVVAGTGADFSYDGLGNLISGGSNQLSGVGGAGTAATGALSPLARLLGLGQTGSDIAAVLGPLAGAGLGYLGSQQQADAYQNVANQQAAIGAPYRNQLAASYQPGFDLTSQPGYGDAFNRIADISSRAYSAKMGNPADNPTAQAGILSDVWNQGYLPALTNYRGQLGQFGGLGLNTSGTASLAGASTAGQGLNAVGYGIGSVTQPQNDIASLLKQLGGNQNYSLNVGGLKYGG